MTTVTVVIPSIPGREELLARAVASVWAQTRKPDAVLLSPDPDRSGAAATRNRALAKVTTEWVGWLDDDDLLLPNHLSICLDHAAKTGADLVYPGMEVVGGRDPLACPVNGILVNPYQVPFGPEQAQHLYEVGNFIPVTYVARTGLVRAAGGFPEPVADPSKGSGRVEEDYGLLRTLLEMGAIFSHAPVKTWRYNFHSANTGGRSADATF